MAESIHIVSASTREEKYCSLLPQLHALVEGEPDFIANTANLVAALKQAMGFFWIGCYFIKGNVLVLGPFQGPVACTRIHKGKGVCGACWQQNAPIIVPDVDQFPGHIACSSDSRSEIVVPLQNPDGSVFGVLDVDSNVLNDFSETDQHALLQVAQLIARCFQQSQEG